MGDEQRLLLARSHDAGRRVGRLEAVGGGLVEAVEQVPVGVERRLDRGMAEALLDDLWMLALGDEQRGVGMPQIVEGAGLPDGGCDGRQPDPASEVAPPDRAPVRRREDEPGIVGVGRQVGGEDVHQERR